jgi:dCTP deaminase
LILGSSAIHEAVLRGDIIIDPFDPEQLSPNSYDFRLGDRCKVYRPGTLDPRIPLDYEEHQIGPEGLLLQPGELYLVNTYEKMGSDVYVPIIRGRSSTGRLGLFINVTADLIDLGSINEWTLQLSPVLPVRIFPGMLVGQVTFWEVKGARTLYGGKYKDRLSPVESLSFLDHKQ